MATSPQRLPVILLAVGLAVLVWSGVAPFDRTTWLLEVLPALIALPILVWTRRSFPLTPLAYWLILIHAVILMVGGRYTYEHVPAGDWVKEMLGLSRNPYDRLGHLAQGFIPAIIAREILLRRGPLSEGGWLFFLVTCICLAISAAYELIEWGVAVAMGTGADAFLGTQGDVWDTQWDMFCALLGSLAAQLTIAPWHSRQLARFAGR